MRVFIDVTGLPWAREYYRMFPFEPSRKLEDDMLLAQATVEHLEHPTLVTVMQAMVKAADAGEKEVLLVAHGFEKGLVMHISATIPFSAEVSTLKWLVLAGEFFDLVDTASSTPQNRAALNAWARIAAFFQTQGDESQVDAMTATLAAQELKTANNDVAKACADLQSRLTQLVVKDAKGLVKRMKTTEAGLREASELALKVREAAFSRIELRACTIGAGPGIEALRTFFQAKRLMCPVVHTFYVQVNAPDNDARHLAAAAQRAGPRFRKFFGDPTAYPLEKSPFPRHVRPFIEPEQVYLPGPLNFMLSVTRVQTPRYVSEARRLNAAAISSWVPKYIHYTARHNGTGALWVGGLDAPTPKREPYTLPQDPNYRSLIAVATPAGVER